MFNVTGSTEQGRTLEGLTAQDILLGFHKSVSSLLKLTVVDLINMTNPQEELISFIEGGLMQPALESLYQAVSAQIAKIYLLDEQKPFDVQEIILETRLQLRGVGFWITECALLVLAAGSIYRAFAFRSSGSRAVKLSRMDQFDLDSINDIQKIGYQYNGMMAANLVLNDDMVLPQWTYDSFVIPELQGDLQHTFDQTPGSPNDRVKATIPSLQATANCTALDLLSPRFNATTGTLTYTLNPPYGGHSAGKNSSILLNREGAFAAWLDLSGQAYHCPEYVVLAGRRHTDNSVDVTALHCSPYLDRVDTHVALTFPDLKADRNAAPRADESTRAFVTTVEIPGIGENLLEPYTDAEAFRALGTVDGFFGTLVGNGAALVADADALRDAVEALYPHVVAQVLHTNRVVAPPAAAEVFDATLELHDRLRLKQTAVSTRALQGLLAVLVLGAAATFLLADTREVLPKNTRSIAAVASLLVDSEQSPGT
ncbi:hypothetical protein BKCO1_2500098 [Neofusicoccum parvum]|uniref:Uncharacterized protein n=1 Tax=Neofusicoccum parvum TaxID=310453 RepID=A0ACB5RRD1_9PEZI|nr:hypothetical protein BKCO1_2500098 [Neofusicoccum parvum]